MSAVFINTTDISPLGNKKYYFLKCVSMHGVGRSGGYVLRFERAEEYVPNAEEAFVPWARPQIIDYSAPVRESLVAGVGNSTVAEEWNKTFKEYCANFSFVVQLDLFLTRLPSHFSFIVVAFHRSRE